MDSIEKARLEQLERCVPDIWGHNSYLYIGAYQGRFHFYERMVEKCIRVDVVEIDRKACDWLEALPGLNLVYCADIKTFLYINMGRSRWDVVIWLHGIETLPKNAGFYSKNGGLKIGMADKEPHTILHRIPELAGEVMVHAVPYGAAGGTGNVAVWYPEDFEKLGYKTDTLGNRDERNSNLLAWKYIK